MVYSVTLATLASSVALASAASVVNIPITKPAVNGDALFNITKQEAGRRASFKIPSALHSNVANSVVGTAPAINTDVTYTTTTTVDQQTFNLIVDTGSSNTWVGAGKRFIPSRSSTSTGRSTHVTYGSGSFYGTEFNTSVSLGGVTAQHQYIGDAIYSKGFNGVDGIIGFGPVQLTAGTVSGLATVPTFLDTLYAQSAIPTEVLGVSFAPIQGSATSAQNGVLTLGGTNSALYTGTIHYAGRSVISPYSYYWGVDVTAITFNGLSVGSAASAIVDTGTTLIYIPTATYNAFLVASSGTTDNNSGLASFVTQPTANFALTIGGHIYTLTPQQYLVPASQYRNFGLLPGKYYAWIADGGADASDVNFIIGQKFMESYYAVFDTTHSRVGFAPRA